MGSERTPVLGGRNALNALMLRLVACIDLSAVIVNSGSAARVATVFACDGIKKPTCRGVLTVTGSDLARPSS